MRTDTDALADIAAAYRNVLVALDLRNDNQLDEIERQLADINRDLEARANDRFDTVLSSCRVCQVAEGVS
jgi:hypothetical protein